jgi:CspA family cold shock protein
MGKGRDFRGPRRRGFDDDMPQPYEPPPIRPSRPFGSSDIGAAPATGPIVDATVKWFNAEKGFGFTELADGSGDAFLHIGALHAVGRETVLPGAKLKIQVGHGAKGAQVAKVIEIDDSAAAEPPPRPGGFGGGAPRGPRRGPDPSTAVPMSGTVKWFNRDKGFGFIASEDGGKDVFVHISILQAAGLADLAEGQPVSMRVAETPKGREAVSVELAG